jgi:hypothetical protein
VFEKKLKLYFTIVYGTFGVYIFTTYLMSRVECNAGAGGSAPLQYENFIAVRGGDRRNFIRAMGGGRGEGRSGRKRQK